MSTSTYTNDQKVLVNAAATRRMQQAAKQILADREGGDEEQEGVNGAFELLARCRVSHPPMRVSHPVGKHDAERVRDYLTREEWEAAVDAVGVPRDGDGERLLLLLAYPDFPGLAFIRWVAEQDSGEWTLANFGAGNYTTNPRETCIVDARAACWQFDEGGNPWDTDGASTRPAALPAELTDWAGWERSCASGWYDETWRFFLLWAADNPTTAKPLWGDALEHLATELYEAIELRMIGE